MGILIYLIELITQKVKSSRKLLEGEPSIIIHKGKLKYDVLKRISWTLINCKAFSDRRIAFPYRKRSTRF